MKEKDPQDKATYPPGYIIEKQETAPGSDSQKIFLSESGSVVADMEATLDNITGVEKNGESGDGLQLKSTNDFKAVMEISLAINSSMALEDILQIMLQKANEVLMAERGFILLLDEQGDLQIKASLVSERKRESGEKYRISESIADLVSATGRSFYTSDAQNDTKCKNLKTVRALNLHSIMCVPLKIKNNVIGIIYLDNSLETKPFLKSDLFLLELIAQQAAHATYNSTLYDHLLDLKEFNEKVVNNSPVGIAVIDSNYNIISMNDAALKALEKNRQNIVTLSPGVTPTRFLSLVPEVEKTRWRQMLDIALTTNQSFEDSRYFYNTEYDEKALSIRITPISKLPYGGDGLILTIEDITEKIIMEKYVILSEKLVARGEMASSIGHELNNYLAIVGNNAELLGLHLKKEKYDRAMSNAQQIVENISKMKRFTDGMMDFSKLETDIVSYDLRNLVDELLFTLKAQARFKKIMFSIDIEPGLPKVAIDVGQMQQVMMNLLYNASDAIDSSLAESDNASDRPARGKIAIKIKTASNKKQVLISVRDNGIGMDEIVRAKIFQPHFTTKENGHGLGLANCKNIIRNHSGEIEVQSEIGRGTVFTIYLPIVTQAEKKLKMSETNS